MTVLGHLLHSAGRIDSSLADSSPASTAAPRQHVWSESPSLGSTITWEYYHSVGWVDGAMRHLTKRDPRPQDTRQPLLQVAAGSREPAARLKEAEDVSPEPPTHQENGGEHLPLHLLPTTGVH